MGSIVRDRVLEQHLVDERQTHLDRSCHARRIRISDKEGRSMKGIILARRVRHAALPGDHRYQ